MNPYNNLVPSYKFQFNRTIDVQCRNHVNIDMEIIFVTNGVLNMCIEGQEYAIGKNRGLFVQPFEEHDFRTYDRSDCYIILTTNKYTSLFMHTVSDKTVIKRDFQLSNELSDYISSECNNQKNENDECYIYNILYPMFNVIKKECIFSSKRKYTDAFLEILTYLNENYMRNITENDIAHEIGIHPFSISRIFSQSANMNIRQYINIIRMQEAAELLQHENCNISQIAYDLGFSTIRNFNYVFKKQFGIQPKEYRKKFSLPNSDSSNSK